MNRLVLAALLACNSTVFAQQPLELAKLKLETPLVAVTVCDQGRELIGIDKEHKVHLWILPIGTQRLIATSGDPTAMAVCSPDGKTLVLATANGSLTVFDTTKNRSAGPMKVSAHEFNSIDVSNGGLIAAALADRPAMLLRGTEKPIGLQIDFGGSNGAAVSADGSLVAIADGDNKVRIYDSSGHLNSKMDVGPLEPFLLAFSPDAKAVYVAGGDGKMRTIDVASGAVTRTSEKFGTAPLAMTMSPKGDEVLVLMMDEYTMVPQSLAIWNAKTNTARKVDLDPKAYIGGGMGKNGWILVKQEEKAISLWELK